MKKTLAVLLAVLVLLSVSVLFASAEDSSVEVYVTISDNEGKLPVAVEKITVTDIDDDGALTINDALYIAHEQFYEGGAAAGYETEMTKYGLSLVRLWGTANGYNYGYYVNNGSAWSLTDPVVTGDYVAAYCITDLEKFSDRYTYFDKWLEESNGGELGLTLSKSDYDEEWNPVVLPVEGAVITINGEPTDVVTNAEGKADITLPELGKYVISAIAPEGQVNVPPVCVAVIGGYEPEPIADPTEEPQEDVTEAPEVPAEDESIAPTETEATQTNAPATKDSATKDSATADSATKDSSSGTSSTPKTGDNTNMLLWVLITVASLIGAGATVMIYRKRYEK